MVVVLSEKQWGKVQKCLQSAKSILGHNSKDHGLFQNTLEDGSLTLADSVPMVKERLSREKNTEAILRTARENVLRLEHLLGTYVASLASTRLDLAGERVKRVEDAALHNECALVANDNIQVLQRALADKDEELGATEDRSVQPLPAQQYIRIQVIKQNQYTCRKFKHHYIKSANLITMSMHI
jgi:hypothetical protein